MREIFARRYTYVHGHTYRLFRKVCRENEASYSFKQQYDEEEPLFTNE